MIITDTITVKQNGVVLATGILVVDTSTNPPTGTFTPTGGSELTNPVLNVSSWSSGPNGPTNWNFRLTSANGNFPIKANGAGHTYNFVGTENANGDDPSGTVNWPDPSLKDSDFEETVTWQAEATTMGEEPYARGQGAS